MRLFVGYWTSEYIGRGESYMIDTDLHISLAYHETIN